MTLQHNDMPYLSEILHTDVEDSWQERVGKLVDVVVQPARVAALSTGSASSAKPPATPAPGARALIVETSDGDLLRVLPEQVAQMTGDAIQLRIPRADVPSDTPQPEEVRLAEEVLNKQVVDLAHKRVVRVNDIRLDEGWHLLGLDATHLGLVRWLAPKGLYEALARRFPAGSLLSWEQTELLPTRQPEAQTEAPPVQPAEALPLARLHPADIADIVHHLSPEEGSRVLAALDDETAAATLEEIDTEHQRRLLERMDSERAANILEQMGPDKAADLLGELPEESAQELLGLMEREESEDVQELLAYPEDSAGGMMTTDYLLIGQDRTASEALARLRAAAIEEERRSAYLYCVADDANEDAEQPLLGVVSIWGLLAAEPERPLRDIMTTNIVSIRPDDDPQTVAEKMAKYNLLALPVLDEQNCLQGIVTVDDAIDVLLPENRRRKPRRMY
jgi:CBS domain-containing protein